MSATILFVLVGLGLTGWYLVARQLTARPWEAEQRRVDDLAEGASISIEPVQVGLWVFLAVVTSLFGLFLSAYGMRMRLPDWQPLADPWLLWVNTVVLGISSFAFQWTRGAAERGNLAGVRSGLLATGFFTLTFLCGQLLVWRELVAAGAFVASNPANAFFYLLTGVHGLHLLGGMVVWGRTTFRAWHGGSRLGELRLSVQLCTVYWHYLLLVWLVLFGLLLTT